MLQELLTIFKNLVLRVATVCSANTQLNISKQTSTTSWDIKKFPKSAIYYKIQTTKLLKLLIHFGAIQIIYLLTYYN